MLFSSQTLFMLHHKVWSGQIRTLCMKSTQSPRFVIDLNFQNLFVYFGMTESSTSVTPSSLSWSRFLISVQPIWTFRSHRVAVTTCDSASRCHRVIPLGHTDRVRIYIPTGQILEIPPKPSGAPPSLVAPSEVTDNVGDERGDASRGIPKLNCLDLPWTGWAATRLGLVATKCDVKKTDMSMWTPHLYRYMILQ